MDIHEGNGQKTYLTVLIPLRQFGFRHFSSVKVTFSSCSIASFNHR